MPPKSATLHLIVLCKALGVDAGDGIAYFLGLSDQPIYAKARRYARGWPFFARCAPPMDARHGAAHVGHGSKKFRCSREMMIFPSFSFEFFFKHDVDHSRRWRHYQVCSNVFMPLIYYIYALSLSYKTSPRRRRFSQSSFSSSR